MDAGTTSASAYRNWKRPLKGNSCNPKEKRLLLRKYVPCPNRRATEMDRSLCKRQRRVIRQAGGQVKAIVDTMSLVVDVGCYSPRELDPLYYSLRKLVSAMHMCAAADAPVEVRPDLYDHDDSTSSSSTPAYVDNRGRGAAFVPVTHGDDIIGGQRRTKANSKYYGPEWAKKYFGPACFD